MTKTDRLLRSCVPQEVVALLEKIDATDSTSDSSYRAAQTLLREGNFSWLERKLIKHAIGKISRRETMVWSMNVVVFNNIDGDIHKPEKADTYNPYRGGVVASTTQHACANQQYASALPNMLGQMEQTEQIDQMEQMRRWGWHV